MNYYIDLGDKRNQYLKVFLEKKGKKCFDISHAKITKSFSKNDCFVFSPAKKFNAAEISMLPNNITLMCGALPQDQQETLRRKNISYYNLMSDEEYVIRNALLTAEGVLSLILEKSEKSIYDNRILILGNGRVAKACATLFNRLNLNYAMVCFESSKVPECLLFSKRVFASHNFLEKAQFFDVIVNSVPAKIIDDENIKKIAPETLFIETASVPCLDKEKIENFTYLPAPGLPQKYCASSAGKIMMKNILGED